MKASALIERLQKLVEKYGDCTIEKEDDEGFLYGVETAYKEPELKDIIVIS